MVPVQRGDVEDRGAIGIAALIALGQEPSESPGQAASTDALPDPGFNESFFREPSIEEFGDIGTTVIKVDTCADETPNRGAYGEGNPIGLPGYNCNNRS
jgi:hypothetical protein